MILISSHISLLDSLFSTRAVPEVESVLEIVCFLCCCNKVIHFSTFSSSARLSCRLGKRDSIANKTSCWFCRNRRRILSHVHVSYQVTLKHLQENHRKRSRNLILGPSELIVTLFLLKLYPLVLGIFVQ